MYLKQGINFINGLFVCHHCLNFDSSWIVNISNASSSKLVESSKNPATGTASDEDWPEANSKMKSLYCHSSPQGNAQYFNLLSLWMLFTKAI